MDQIEHLEGLKNKLRYGSGPSRRGRMADSDYDMDQFDDVDPQVTRPRPRMYKSKMPPFKQRAGRLAQEEADVEMEEEDLNVQLNQLSK